MGKYRFNPLSWKRKNWKPGFYAVDGHPNIYVKISKKGGRRTGYFRWQVSKVDENGRYLRKPDGSTIEEPHMLSLGELVDFEDLVEACKKGPKLRKMVKTGELRDPREYNRQLRAAKAVENAPKKSFDECWKDYVAKHRHGWRSAKHASEWEHSRRIVEPAIGNMDITAVTRHDFSRALADIWCRIPTTATRTLGRMIAIHDQSIADGLVPEDNRISLELTKRSLGSQGIRVKEHLAALPYADVPALAKLLKGRSDPASQCLLFAILTAARSNEVLGARWNEITGDTWTVPAARMKRHREHKVPLSSAAKAVLDHMLKRRRKFDGVIFPGRYHGQFSGAVLLDALHRVGISGVTVHGFRSSFRDWCAEKDNAPPREVAEAALAHGVADNETEAAYLRSTFFDKRKLLMQEWADYCLATAEVIQLRDAS